MRETLPPESDAGLTTQQLAAQPGPTVEGLLFWWTTGAILLSALLLSLMLDHQRNQALTDGERLTKSFALAIEEQTTRTLQATDQRLQLAAIRFNELKNSGQLTEQSARQLLQSQVKELPFARAMWVMDAKGRITHDSDTGNIGVNLSDRPYFQIYRDRPDTGFHIGAPVRSRSLGTWLLSASRPLYSSRGELAGIIVTALEPPYFDNLWRTLELGTGGSIALFNAAGVLMTRTPFDDAVMGKSFAQRPVFSQMLPRAPTGMYRDNSGIDGTERLFAYRKLPVGEGMVVIVGKSIQDILAPWRHLSNLAWAVWAMASAAIVILSIVLNSAWRQRRATDEQFKRMSQRLELATDAALVGVWDWDLVHDIWYASATYYRMMGYAPVVGPGKRSEWLARLHPQDLDMVEAQINTVLAGDASDYQYEARMRHADGGYRWVLVKGRVLSRQDNGQPSRLLGVRLDITEEHRARQSLATTAALLERTGELAKVGGWSLAVPSMRVFWSQQTFRIFELEPPEAPDLDPSIEAFIPASHQAPLRAAIQTAIETGRSFELELPAVTHTGKSIWLRAQGSAEQEGGHTVRLQGALQDITETRRARVAFEENLGRYRTLFDYAPDGILIADQNGFYLDANASMCRMLGMTHEELVGLHASDIVPPSEVEHIEPALVHIQTSDNYQRIWKFRRHDGSTFAADVIATQMPDGMLMAMVRDITEQQAAEQLIQDSQNELREVALHTQTILDNLLDGVITINEQGLVQTFNKSACLIFGYAPSDVIGRNVSMLMPEPHHSHHDSYLDNYRKKGTQHVIGRLRELEGQRRDGSIFPMSLQVSQIASNGKTTFVGVVRDITQHRQDVEEIRRLAFYDPLTGLPNRRLLIDRLSQAILTSTRTGQHGALMFLDLDHFKQLNDSLGHDLGDVLLQQVALRLEGCVREGDSVARLGGDEFVVLLEALSMQAHEAATQAEFIAHKILVAFAQAFNLRGHSHESTASIGIVVFMADMHDVDDLLRRADVAMYQAKSAGRNTARFFDPAMQAAVTAHETLEKDLRRGLALHEFVLYYQIQVNDATEAIGVEALVRWQHPERGLISPAHFIPLAEETGMILPLGQWVLETACTQLAAWAHQPATAHWTMSVNVSASQFAQPDFVAHVDMALGKTGANPVLLKLELTESMLVDDLEGIIIKMNLLKSRGVGFSLDDFGTGYSSLSHLKRLPLDQLKIDQSFVRDVLTNSSDAVIARTIVGLGHSLGLKVIAEGVESRDQQAYLATLGCDGFQGYYFGLPSPPELLPPV